MDDDKLKRIVELDKIAPKDWTIELDNEWSELLDDFADVENALEILSLRARVEKYEMALKEIAYCKNDGIAILSWRNIARRALED